MADMSHVSDELETIAAICNVALKTQSRDLHDWMQDIERIKDKADALLASPPEAPREGWKWVPVEPTKEMLFAGVDCDGMRTVNAWVSEMQLLPGRKPDWSSDNPPLTQAYRAMLAAAPSRSEEK